MDRRGGVGTRVSFPPPSHKFTCLLELLQQISAQNTLLHQHKQWTRRGREDKAQEAVGDMGAHHGSSLVSQPADRGRVSPSVSG